MTPDELREMAMKIAGVAPLEAHRLFEWADQLDEIGAVPVEEPSGHSLKDIGQEQAMSSRAAEAWKAAFWNGLRLHCYQYHQFTSEDILDFAGLPRKDVRTNANNAVGAMMSAAARKGYIIKTGRRVLSKRPTSHAAELTEWVWSGELITD